jgi:nucleoside-diphosphate-sugar epimerase
VHADDVAQAYRLALVRDARGAYNVAAEPVLDAHTLAELLDARVVPLPARVARAATALSFRLRLQPTPAGWLDLGRSVPLMDTSRAQDELGWRPRWSATGAVLDLLDGLRAGAGAPTPPLDPAESGPARSREVLSGVGGSDPYPRA